MRNDKWKPEMANAWVTWVRIGFGQLIYLLYVHNHTLPIGLVWGYAEGKRFIVGGSFVQPFARRQGVRTRINDAIFEHLSVISTSAGSKEGGRAFLKARGYRFDKRMKCFFLQRPKRAAKRK